jgi:peptide/nickel transport system substrate-binding protein
MKTLLKWTAGAVIALSAITGASAANTLKWGAARDLDSLDPYSYGSTFNLAFLNHVYEALIRYDDKFNITPALAESWEATSPTVLRFHLRKGVKFHNGAPFSADDVVASMTRVSDDASPLKGNLPAFKAVRKVDDYTVDIEMTHPYPLMLNDLTNIFIFNRQWLVDNNSLKPTDAAKKIEGYATHNANGTGPFKVESYRPDTRTVLVVNPDWWDKPRHNLDRIEFTPIASAPTRVAALLSGDINFTENAPLQDLDRLRAAPNVKVLASTELRTLYFGFNLGDKLVGSNITDKNPLKDLRVRQALYMALSPELIQKRVMRGLSRTTGALVAPSIPGYQEKQEERLPFDAARAKKLLAEAGYPDGFTASLLCSNDMFVNEEEICQAAASMWARIGVKASLASGPRSLQNPKRSRGEFDITIHGWANEPQIDALSILLQVMHSRSGPAGVFNWGQWGDAALDARIDAAAAEMDRPKRVRMMEEILQTLHDDARFLPLHQQPMAWAVGNKVGEVLQMPDNKARLWTVRMQ